MYDPQTIEMIVFLVVTAFFLVFIIGLIYGLVLLAKIRSQAVRINKRLDELLARSPTGSTSPGDTKVTL